MKHCCSRMESQLKFKCEKHAGPFDCPDKLIHFSEQKKHYGIIVHDGGSSWIEIKYCPWCGHKL